MVKLKRSTIMKKLVLSMFVFLAVMLFTSAAVIFNTGGKSSGCPYLQKVNSTECPYLNGSGNTGKTGKNDCPFKENENVRLIERQNS